jgi:hypothetical protein
MVLALLIFNTDNKTAQDFWSQKEAYIRFVALPGSLLPSKDDIFYMSTALAEMTSRSPQGPSQWPEELAAMRAYRHMLQYARSRRLFRTNLGCLGLAPAASQVGDAVSFLNSARVPFILREKEDEKFELIGDAYVHGYMNGEIDELGPPNIRDI